MALVLQCPQCGQQVRVPAELEGKMVRCPSCQATFTAAADGSYAASPPPPMARRDEPSPYEDELEYDDRPRRRHRGRGHLTPHRGGMILTFGIISLVIGCIGLIFGIMAWVMGNNDLREMRAGRMDPEGEGMTQAGRICGMISVILHIVAVVFYMIIFGILIAARAG